MKYVYVNGFWPGFAEKTNGVHFGFFEALLQEVVGPITITQSIAKADILLESHFGPTLIYVKQWPLSLFFSGEGSQPIPLNPYSCVLGCQGSGNRYVPCPLYLAYEYCVPGTYSAPITTVPTKPVCAVVSSFVNQSKRIQFLQFLLGQSIPIDFGGSFANSIGRKIPGEYYEQPILDFLQQYRLVAALENTVLDDYITEKVINPLRAGTVPLYLGSAKIPSYINPERIVQIDPEHFETCLPEIKRLLTEDAYWLEKVNKSPFTKSLQECMSEIVANIKSVLSYRTE